MFFRSQLSFVEQHRYLITYFRRKLDLTQINLNNGTGISTITKETNKITIDPQPAEGDISGTVVIKGDLIVDGTTTTINSTTVDISDRIITLNSALFGTPSLDVGLQVNRGNLGA